MPYYSSSTLETLITQALIQHNTSENNAKIVANALIKAELDGIRTHGLGRLVAYCQQAKNHKVEGYINPKIERLTPSALGIDVGFGFAYPAIALGIQELAPMAQKMGIAIATFFRSHHFGVAGHHVEKLAAEHGLLAIMFGNAPKSIAPWGGKQALFGTNPIAFACPRESEQPLVIDMSLSKVARGKVMLAQQQGEAIPDDWALDEQGNPTTDPNEALKGTMLPLGDAKGAALILMVEILSTCLTGANFSYQSSSFLDDKGAPPGVGQTLIAINPEVFAGNTYAPRMEELLTAYLSQDDTRLPAARRYAIREKSKQEGIEVSTEFYQQIVALAAKS